MFIKDFLEYLTKDAARCNRSIGSKEEMFGIMFQNWEDDDNYFPGGENSVE